SPVPVRVDRNLGDYRCVAACAPIGVANYVRADAREYFSPFSLFNAAVHFADDPHRVSVRGLSYFWATERRRGIPGAFGGRLFAASSGAPCVARGDDTVRRGGAVGLAS